MEAERADGLNRAPASSNTGKIPPWRLPQGAESVEHCHSKLIMLENTGKNADAKSSVSSQKDELRNQLLMYRCKGQIGHQI